MHSFTPLDDIPSVVSILSQIPIFGGVTEAQQKEIFRRLERGIFGKGDYVFRHGDEPTHIYIVKSGVIDLQITDNRAIVNKKALGVGECFGHVALISMQKHSLTAIALEESEIIVLSRRALNQLRHEDLELFALLMMNLARELARRLKFTDDMLLHTMRLQPETQIVL